MSRMLSLFLPLWSIETLKRRSRRLVPPASRLCRQSVQPGEAGGVRNPGGRSPDRPPRGGSGELPRLENPPRDLAVALTSRQANRELVVAVCAAARAQGVRPGMTVAHARALLVGQPAGHGTPAMPGACRIEPLQPALDRQALDALAQWALRFSPMVQVDPVCSPAQGGLLMDITGCQRLFGGEENLLHQLRQALRRLGFTVRVVSAGTIGCAWAMAHYGQQPEQCIPDGAEAQAVAPLPAAALRLEEATVKALGEVGLRGIGQILPLSARSLRERFGPELPRRIDQALGRAWEAVEPVGQVSTPRALLELAGPVRDLEALKLGAQHLLGKLLAELGARDLGIRRLRLVFKRSDAPPVALEITLAQASRDQKHLWTLLRPAVDRVNMGFGVEALDLSAADTARLEQAQLPLLPQVLEREASPRMKRCLGELVDVLASRLGRGGVLAIHEVEAHVPERTFALQPAAEMWHGRPARASATGAATTRVSRASRPRKTANAAGTAATLGDRPSLLLDRPEPVHVTSLSPDGPVVSFTRLGGRHPVRTCLGPERIAPQWWGEAPVGISARDYFKLQDDQGRWLWIYRQLPEGRWFIHGLWE